MKKQRRKIYIALTFVLLWLCSLWGSASDIAIARSKKAGDLTFDISGAATSIGIPGEEDWSRTFFSGDIKLLPTGIPIQGFCDGNWLYYNTDNTSGFLYTAVPVDLKHHIEQLIFPFHFFY